MCGVNKTQGGREGEGKPEIPPHAPQSRLRVRRALLSPLVGVSARGPGKLFGNAGWDRWLAFLGQLECSSQRLASKESKFESECLCAGGLHMGEDNGDLG